MEPDNEIEKQLFELTVDTAKDFAEIGLDAIISDASIKEIPVIGTIISIFKIGKSIKERHFIRKLLIFLQDFKRGTHNDNERMQLMLKLNESNRFKNKVMDNVVSFIDRFDHEIKSSILAHLLIAYLSENISWSDFIDFEASVDRMYLTDIMVLINLSEDVDEEGKLPRDIIIETTNVITVFAALQRSTNYGFIEDERKPGMATKAPLHMKYKLNMHGRRFYNYGVSKIDLSKLYLRR